MWYRRMATRKRRRLRAFPRCVLTTAGVAVFGEVRCGQVRLVVVWQARRGVARFGKVRPVSARFGRLGKFRLCMDGLARLVAAGEARSVMAGKARHDEARFGEVGHGLAGEAS